MSLRCLPPGGSPPWEGGQQLLIWTAGQEANEPKTPPNWNAPATLHGRRQIYLAHRSATCFRFALSIDLRDSLPDGQMKYENTKTQIYKDTLRKVGIRNSRT